MCGRPTVGHRGSADGTRAQARCWIPKCGGIVDHHAASEALWAGFSSAAPLPLRRSFGRSNYTQESVRTLAQALRRQTRPPSGSGAVRQTTAGARMGPGEAPVGRADVGGRGDHRRLPPARIAAAGRLPLQPAADPPAPSPARLCTATWHGLSAVRASPGDRAEARWARARERSSSMIRQQTDHPAFAGTPFRRTARSTRHRWDVAPRILALACSWPSWASVMTSSTPSFVRRRTIRHPQDRRQEPVEGRPRSSRPLRKLDSDPPRRPP